jgi:hypothetical protein
MPEQEPRAKVFVSCGQSKQTDEIEVARRVADRLHGLGYEAYAAVEEQTLKGLKENIFRQLETSEYFIFIDFKRERLVIEGHDLHRGSVFCQQELAIASFLGLDADIIALQEKGVKPEDGIIRFLQANVISFSDRDTLHNVIADLTKQRGWNPAYKRALCLSRDEHEFTDAYLQDVFEETGRRIIYRYFHIRVDNLSSRQPALNCYAYLERIRDVSKSLDIHQKQVELKWEGWQSPNATITPNGSRGFDGFLVPHSEPFRLVFNVIADSERFFPRIQGPGEYEITYSVLSETFPLARATFFVRVGEKLDEISIQRNG